MENLSRQLFQRARRLSPGGVHSPVRAFHGVHTSGSDLSTKTLSPIFFETAQGAFLYSCDGNRYIDFCQSFGPLILGHRDPDVSLAVEKMIQKAWTFGACEPYSLELSQWIVDHVPHVEKLRFVSTGTEAVMSALRLARGATGRHKVIKFEGNYHGHVDSLLVKAGSGLAGTGASDSAGVSPKVASETIVLPLGDSMALEKAFENHQDEIAAIIVEPLPANFGLLKQENTFLRFLREISTSNGALLIFDEVISGFRVALGGMAEISGVKPDLVTYGKVIGGGFPVGCFGGQSKWMDLMAPLGPVYQAGTLSAHPVGMVAGLVTLEKIKKENGIKILNQRTQTFVKNLDSAIAHYELPLKITHFASLMWIHGSSKKDPQNIGEVASDQKRIFSQLYTHCLDQGLYLSPGGYEVSFLSLAHDEQVLKESEKRFKKAFETLKETLDS